MHQLVSRPLLVALLAIACTRPSAVTPAASTTAEITPADLERRLFLIAHDSMMGRESGSDGDFKAAEYVASEFRRLGLEPAGERGTYFQTVPFWRAAVDPTAKLVEQLGAAEFADREAAAKTLREMGLKAEAALRAGLRSDNPEVRERTTKLLTTIRADALDALAKDFKADGTDEPDHPR